jgi:hypothetical protein
MTQLNYTTMTDRELKQYILGHREDLVAFQAYMDRRHSRPNRTIIQIDDPDWEQKVLSAMRLQISTQ